jgi:sulfatase maturation enzyme AslB (radical SAM superfamily)
MLNKYPNTESYNIDNKWIEQDSFIWDNIKENIQHTKRFNFLGGEPFANKQHNKFIESIANSTYAKDITLSYVSNGTLLSKKMFDCLKNFKLVIIRLSLDVLQEPGEYFRFPIKWNVFEDKLKLMQDYAAQYDNFDIGVQWTCSNISMFYLPETFDYMQNYYPAIKFIFANHVEWPIHMSAQVLPLSIKKIITDKVSQYDFKEYQSKVPFYINHMNEKNLWNDHGKTLLQYLDDLDIERKLSWRHSFKEMNLENTNG